MEEQALATETQPLSEAGRVINTFVAPTRTFHDVLRRATWWLPFVLILLSGYVLTAAIQTKVGWQQLAENEIRANPKLTERMASLPKEQVATQQRMMQVSFRTGFYAGPLFNLAFVALSSLVLWGTINFGFGGRATFGRLFCVGMYAALPGALTALLAAVMLFAGRDAESFTTQNLLGSNPGYYVDTAGPLKVFLSTLDVFTLWSLVLLSLGVAIVAHTKRSTGFVAVFGWFVVIVLGRTAVAAMNS